MTWVRRRAPSTVMHPKVPSKAHCNPKKPGGRHSHRGSNSHPVMFCRTAATHATSFIDRRGVGRLRLEAILASPGRASRLLLAASLSGLLLHSLLRCFFLGGLLAALLGHLLLHRLLGHLLLTFLHRLLGLLLGNFTFLCHEHHLPSK